MNNESEHPYLIKVQSHWLTRKPNANSDLVALLILVFLFMLSFAYWYDWWNLKQLLSGTPLSVFQKREYWRAWTTLFVHADLKHLIGNSFLFSILGYFLYGYFGGWVFPIVSIVFGGFINLIVLSGMPEYVELIGMSGVVFWMGGSWLALYSFLETRKTFSQRLLRAFGVTLVLFMPSEAFDPHISYQSHFYGFLLGVSFGVFYYFLKRKTFKAAETYTIEPIESIESTEPTDEATGATLDSVEFVK